MQRRKSYMSATLAATTLLLMGPTSRTAVSAAQQQEAHKHAAASKENHVHDSCAMMARGEDAKGMGFSQTETTHHFLLQKDGGTIQVEVNDPKNTFERDKVRTHLTHIAHLFSEGNFEIPMFVHDKMPDGAETMKEKKDAIRYRFEQTPNGGRVRMGTRDAEALKAVHAFMRFQIDEHKTGDPLEAPLK